MNILDIGIVLLLIMFFITGFKRGVIKELASLIGIVLVFIISYQLKGYIGNILCYIFPFFKFSGSIEGLSILNIIMYQAIAFLIIFSLLLSLYEIILKLSKALQKIVNMTIILIIPSKILGGLISMLKGYILLFVIFIVLLVPLRNQNIFYESKMINHMLYKSPILSKYTNKEMNAITEIYDLGEKVTKKQISTNAANKKGLDIILKYNITDKKTIENLIKIHKLDNINNVDEILNNY